MGDQLFFRSGAPTECYGGSVKNARTLAKRSPRRRKDCMPKSYLPVRSDDSPKDIAARAQD